MNNNIIKITSKQEYKQQNVMYCAWCKGVFDRATMALIRYVDDINIPVSHGICPNCKLIQLAKEVN